MFLVRGRPFHSKMPLHMSCAKRTLYRADEDLDLAALERPKDKPHGRAGQSVREAISGGGDWRRDGGFLRDTGSVRAESRCLQTNKQTNKGTDIFPLVVTSVAVHSALIRILRPGTTGSGEISSLEMGQICSLTSLRKGGAGRGGGRASEIIGCRTCIARSRYRNTTV